jgi:hypothetical protein
VNDCFAHRESFAAAPEFQKKEGRLPEYRIRPLPFGHLRMFVPCGKLSIFSPVTQLFSDDLGLELDGAAVTITPQRTLRGVFNCNQTTLRTGRSRWLILLWLALGRRSLCSRGSIAVMPVMNGRNRSGVFSLIGSNLPLFPSWARPVAESNRMPLKAAAMIKEVFVVDLMVHLQVICRVSHRDRAKGSNRGASH